MRAIVQRVKEASVKIDGLVVGEIDDGLLLLVGISRGDGPIEVSKMVSKVSELRVFADDAGRMNRSVLDTGGGILVVSQFTLIADVSKGRRPSFVGAAPPEQAEPLINEMCTAFEGLGIGVATGVFGAKMDVELVNDGPVTVVVDVADGRVI